MEGVNLYPEFPTVVKPEVLEKDFKYKYPFGLDLRPSTKLHQNVVGEIMRRARASRSSISPRYAPWNLLDEKFTAYIPASELETRAKTKDRRKPVAVVVPTMFVAYDTIKNYVLQLFNQRQVFTFDPVGANSMRSSLLLGIDVDLQMDSIGLPVKLSTAIRDALIYGFCAVGVEWCETWGKRQVMQERMYTDELGIENVSQEYVSTPYIEYQGNDLFSIDPYLFLPDPNVPIERAQEGEFVGWIDRKNENHFLRKERYDRSMFNAKYLEGIDGRSSLFDERSGNRDRYGVKSGSSDNQRRNVDYVYMCIDIIPSRWGLGKLNRPEKWEFLLAGDTILLKAAPIYNDHQKYPLGTAAPDTDGYSCSPISRMETIFGMQEFEDFQFNSRITNMRQMNKGWWLIDDKYIRWDDFLNREERSAIRLNSQVPAFGKSLKDIVMAFPVPDATSQNISDAQQAWEMMQRGSGAVDAMQGVVAKGRDRVSATESQNTLTSALGRINGWAWLFAEQLLVPLGKQIGSNTQQFRTEDVWFKIVGSYANALQGIYLEQQNGQGLISPHDIMDPFRVKVSHGLSPSETDSNASVQLFNMVRSDPELRMKYDLARWVESLGIGMGMRNISEFRLMMPQQMGMPQQPGMPMQPGVPQWNGSPIDPYVGATSTIDQQAQAGNLVDIRSLQSGVA